MRWYEPVAPRRSLDSVLACSWTATPSGRHRLVPDACIDVLWVSTGDVWLCAPERSAWWFQLPEGVVGAGVRFLPGVLPALAGFDASRIVDTRVRWREVVGLDAERSIAEALAAAVSDEDRRRLWEDDVERRRGEWGPLDPVAMAVIDHLATHPRVRATELAHVVGLTPRQLHRRCLVSFGYGVSTLSRIVRFHRFWSAAELAEPGTPLGAIAHEAGYSDQAHLARDCRAITGSTPGRFLAESFATFPDMSDPYKTGGAFAGTLVR